MIHHAPATPDASDESDAEVVAAVAVANRDRIEALEDRLGPRALHLSELKLRIGVRRDRDDALFGNPKRLHGLRPGDVGDREQQVGLLQAAKFPQVPLPPSRRRQILVLI